MKDIRLRPTNGITFATFDNPYLARREEMNITFLQRIRRMNEIMEVTYNDTPTDLGEERVFQFESILTDEIYELKDVAAADNVEDRMVGMADLLGDVIVYCTSEAGRWGIPIDKVLSVIMDSQDSKLVDGNPVPGDRPGKFGKDPDYRPPEEDIRKILFPTSERIEKPYVPVPVVTEDDIPVGPGDGLRKRVEPTEESSFYSAVGALRSNTPKCAGCLQPLSDEIPKRIKRNVPGINVICPNCGVNMKRPHSVTYS